MQICIRDRHRICASVVKEGTLPTAVDQSDGSGGAGPVGFGQATGIAVSYTHLDVYKRQGFVRRVGSKS